MQSHQDSRQTNIAAGPALLAETPPVETIANRSFVHARAGRDDKPVLRLKGLDIGLGTPNIIASITARDAIQALQQAQDIAASGDVDIAEFRLDYLSASLGQAGVVELVASVAESLLGKPLLVTFRSAQEGGERSMSDNEYFDLYSTLVEQPAIDLIDVEMMKPEDEVTRMITEAHAAGVAVVLSNHEFDSTPPQSTIVNRLRKQQSLGADILKIAAMPKSANDVLTLMAASQEMYTSHAQRPLITMSMGTLGVVSRLAGELTGSALTYASVGAPSAPGQVSADDVKSVLNVLSSKD
jgi:3-dehydroquinate dehydratase-1